ncbi:pyridoxamine 5'-phosphate oxidase family protein [Yoonia sp. F2084L]|uniref:pyridoxamine 5'-phosphate oxidase family protein n=1 Tax=Yoonia sp. F2084L TaxID=2926419 RepID=UPI001FF6C528|nr:pyridoxamine 5'-phosphate oxidase family protein [Yoonia sp. F2084L]MCK0094195.1 pyridoxamine 5'-phosphate oxidase family protein [Yoonia sp. F2084L]
MSYKPETVLTTMAEVRAVIDGIHKAQQLKVLDHIDTYCRVWIERSPFIVMSTVDTRGNLDASPKGDPAGFVKIVDQKTLAIPDRPGNHRFDSFQNILQTGRIGLVFMVPNRNEVVRVNGSAQIVRDTALRESMAIKGRVPAFAIVVNVEEAFYHCGKAIIRSKLWSPDEAATVDGLPTYGEALFAQAKSGLSHEEIAARLKHNDENRLYDE